MTEHELLKRISCYNIEDFAEIDRRLKAHDDAREAIKVFDRGKIVYRMAYECLVSMLKVNE